ncbi:MAG: amidohydrolase family protein [Dehalococcoidia bacterium]
MADATMVIDADGHVSESAEIDWQAYLDDRLKPLAPQRRVDDDGMVSYVVEGRTTRSEGQGAGIKASLVTKGNKLSFRPGMTDPEARMTDMDLEGIDVAVLFGGRIGLGVSGLVDAELATGLARAYNDWLAGYCAAHPDRLKGVAAIALQDIDQAVRELHRAVDELGMVGVAIPTNFGGRNLDDPYFHPFYEAAQGLDVPVCVHIASYTTATPNVQGACIERFDKFFFTHSVLHPFEQMMAAASLLCEGVLERFPTLRVAFMEAGAGWVPYWMHRLDEHYERLRTSVGASRAPSEFFRSEQVFVSCEPDEPLLPAVLELVGEDRIVYASDYCHYDCSFPESAELIRRRSDLSDGAKSKVLGGNALKLFGPRLGMA